MESNNFPSPYTVSRRALMAGMAAIVGVAAVERIVRADPAFAATLNTLKSSQFNWQVDQASGGVFTVQNAADALGTNFVINSTSEPQFDVKDSRWFGDLIFAVRAAGASGATTMVTGLSDDIRKVSQSGSTITVTYSGSSSNAAGIRGFSVVETYTLNAAGTAVTWSFTLKNTSAQALEFLDVGFPLLMNSYWDGGQTAIYEERVSRHSFVAQDGSYIYWTRPNGVGPFLLMAPLNGTRLEYKNKARAGEGPFGEADPVWEGLVEYYIHSKNIAPQRSEQAGSYLPATSMTLAAGISKTYGFTFTWAPDYTGLRNAIYNAGIVDAISMPGMVIPQDGPVTLAVRAMSGISSVTGEAGKNITVSGPISRGGYKVYTLTFANLGANLVTVAYGGGRTSVLQYYSIRPIEELIEKHSAFVVANQQATTTHGYNGAFLQWDMARKKLITWDTYPGGGWQVWMAGGSDDLGLAPAEYLSAKNFTLPVQDEVAAVDRYITDFLLGYLQSATSGGVRTWQVYRWYDGRDGTPSDTGVWRSYNYMHIANTYYAMYRIRKAYSNLSMRFTAAEYINMCFQTLNAMYTKIPQPTPIGDAAHQLGLMGEGTYPEILAALTTEGMTASAKTLRGFLQAKYNYFKSVAYPFASEQTIDTTGFEAAYTLARMFGDTAMATKTQRASIASRGFTPIWYWYGSDNRTMGESWWNLGYETPLGAWQQQQYLQTAGTPGTSEFDDAVRQTNGAYLGGWANINSGQIDPATANIGAASWLYQSEKGAIEYDWMSNLNNWWSWSGEAELGFWGCIRTATVSVVNDNVIGLYAYHGSVTLTGGKYTISPRDGVRQRFVIFPSASLTVTLDGVRYTKAVVAQDRTSIELTLQNIANSPYNGVITIANLPAGTYKVTVANATVTTSFTSNGSIASCTLPLFGAPTDVVTISKV